VETSRLFCITTSFISIHILAWKLANEELTWVERFAKDEAETKKHKRVHKITIAKQNNYIYRVYKKNATSEFPKKSLCNS
jgi:beta-xylosidase